VHNSLRKLLYWGAISGTCTAAKRWNYTKYGKVFSVLLFIFVSFLINFCFTNFAAL